MLKIVVKRMKGRKGRRDLLSLVLFLSFLFMLSALLFFHNQGINAQLAREMTYGTWENALYFSDAKTVEEVQALPEVLRYGKTRVIGRDKRFGLVASSSEEFEQLGNFRLKEGRMPEAADEIALEEKQLIHFKGLKLGDETILAVEVKEGEENQEFLLQLILYERHNDFIKDLQDHPEVLESVATRLERYYGSSENLPRGTITDTTEEDPYRSPINVGNIFFRNIRQRNENVLEGHHGTQMAARRELFYLDTPLAQMLPEDWQEKYAEFPTTQSIIMQRDVKIVGILENYSETWKGDNQYKPNAFVNEETASKFLDQALYLSEKIDMSHHVIPTSLFLKSELGANGFLEKYETKFTELSSNDYAYPPGEAEKEGLIRKGTLLFLALVTTFSVFYVYQSKFQKQVRSLGLFRALGATKDQLYSYMLLEMLLRSLRSLLFALPLAFVFSYFVIGKGAEVFDVPWGLLLLGILLCFVAIFIATLLPLRKLKYISLTGSIQLKDKKKKKTRDLLKNAKALKSFDDMEKRHELYGKHKRRLRLVQLSALLLVLLLCLLMIFLSFEEYRNDIVATGRPDYAFKIMQRGGPRLIERTKEEFLASPVIEKIETLVRAERMFLDFKGNKGDPVYDDFLSYLPERYESDHRARETSSLPKAFRLDIFSLEEEGEAYTKLKRILPADFDEEAFRKGRGAILITPSFKRGTPSPRQNDLELFLDTSAGNRLRTILEYYDAYDFEVDERYEKLYEKTTTFHGLKEVKLYELKGIEMGAAEYLPEPQYIGKTIELLAHLHSLPKEGIWPFSYEKDYPILLFSRRGMQDYFGYSSFIKWENRSVLEGVRLLGAWGQGQTYFYLDTVDRSPETEMALRALGEPYHMNLENLGKLGDQLYQKGLAGALLSGLLGFVILLITSQILYQGFKSELEEEAFRIGTLQSMGVQAKDMQKSYLRRAIEDVLLALVLSHLVYGVLLILLSFRGQGVRLLHLGSLLQLMLWKYPWGIHLLLVLLFALVGVLTSYLPLKRVLQRTPLDNIRYN